MRVLNYVEEQRGFGVQLDMLDINVTSTLASLQNLEKSNFNEKITHVMVENKKALENYRDEINQRSVAK